MAQAPPPAPTHWDLVGERGRSTFGNDIWEEGQKNRSGALEGLGRSWDGVWRHGLRKQEARPGILSVALTTLFFCSPAEEGRSF